MKVNFRLIGIIIIVTFIHQKKRVHILKVELIVVVMMKIVIKIDIDIKKEIRIQKISYIWKDKKK